MQRQGQRDPRALDGDGAAPRSFLGHKHGPGRRLSRAGGGSGYLSVPASREAAAKRASSGRARGAVPCSWPLPSCSFLRSCCSHLDLPSTSR